MPQNDKKDNDKYMIKINHFNLFLLVLAPLGSLFLMFWANL